MRETTVCAACGTENAPGAKFCSECGARLAPAPAPLEERKVVSVVFCDVVGSTARAESADPEDVRAALNAFYSRVRADLERFGGTVEKYIGDAVMAVFGAPVAHEDDAERAVRAALAIRDWAREEEGVEVRIAVNTGEALVSVDARPAAGEAMVAGDVVNTAARLQAAAPVNGILVGEATHRATERAIEYTDAKPVEAKGKAEPVAVWEVVAARSRLGVDLGQAGRSPLVGRAREVELLHGAMARVRAEQTPHLVTLVGVPGIGKSRLVRELFGALEADPELIAWRQGRSLPYGEGVTYWALAEMVKAQAGILESDEADEAHVKLTRAVAGLVAEDESAWVEGHLRALLGQGDDEQRSDTRAEAFAAWRRFFEAIAEESPLVLVFEDVHWADDGLLDFVDHLVDWASGVPVLLVCTARPELLTRRPGWGGGKLNATTLALSPLSAEETARLVHAVLDQAVLPAELQAALLERAGGNPLYAEEFARITAERGGEADDLPLPDSIQSLLAARVDALPALEKAVLEDAAVIGKVFWSGSVAGLGDANGDVDGALHELVRKEFIQRERRSSIAGEDQYAFRHSLVRDVAYGQIPRARRADKHRRAAGWIGALGRPEEHAELLAHHYERALDFARASGQDLGDLAVQARTAMREAGDRASGLNAARAAAHFYAAALELWPEDDPERAGLLLALGRAYEPFDPEAAGRVLAEARAALLVANRPDRAAEADVVLADIDWRHADAELARAHLDSAAALVAEAPASPSKAFVLSQVARFHMLAARSDEALRFAEQALAMADELELDDVRADALNNIGSVEIILGRPEGIPHLEESNEILERLGSLQLLRSSNNLVHALLEHGELERADEEAERGLAAARRFGYAEGAVWLREKRAQVGYLTGRWDDALGLIEEALTQVEAEGAHYLESSWCQLRSLLSLGRGDRGAAARGSERALDLARQIGDPQMLQPALAVRIRILVELGQSEEASDVLDELLVALGERRGLRSQYWVHLSDAALVLGREGDVLAALPEIQRGPWVEAARDVAARAFERAAATLAAIGALTTEADVRRRLATQLIAAGRRADGEAELDRALEFWRSVGATAYLQEAQALLEVAS